MNDTLKFLAFIWGKCINGVESYTKDSFEIIEHGAKSNEDESLLLNVQIKFETRTVVGAVKIIEDEISWMKWNSPHKGSVVLVVCPKEKSLFLSFSGIRIDSFTPSVQVDFIHRYNELLYHGRYSCGEILRNMNGFDEEQFISRLTIERLTDKCDNIAFLHSETNNNWSDTSIAVLFDSVMISNKTARNLYCTLIRTIGYNSIISNLVVDDYKESVFNIEALLFGASGLLNVCQENEGDEYTYALRQRFDIIKNRYSIKPMNPDKWKYAIHNRNNILHLQLAQLAAILASTPTMHYKLVQEDDLMKIINLFKVKISDYWHNHDKLGKKSLSKREVVFAKAKLDLLIINFVVPYLFYYNSVAKVRYDENKNDKLIEFLNVITDEKNGMITPWREYVVIDSAFRSQAIIQLAKKYCADKNCYKCTLGRKYLNKFNIF